MSNKTWKGQVSRSDLEGGYLTLTVGRETYKLEGAVSGLAPGQTVEIEGQVDGGAMGIGFGSPVLKVRSHKTV